MKIDVWEVIDAAKTKRSGSCRSTPGPGPRRHCIPIDPFYLSWKARQSGFEARFIELAGQVEQLDARVGRDAGADALNSVRKAVKRVARPRVRRRLQEERRRHARIARLDVIQHLLRRGAAVSYSDPYVPSFRNDGHSFAAISTADALASRPDCVVVTTDHDAFDYRELVERAPLIMDRPQRAAGVRRPAHPPALGKQSVDRSQQAAGPDRVQLGGPSTEYWLLATGPSRSRSYIRSHHSVVQVRKHPGVELGDVLV